MQNGSFICSMCGKEKYCKSILTVSCGYGSLHDGDLITATICGDCADKVINLLKDLEVDNEEIA